jgi:hypothetical protein
MAIKLIQGYMIKTYCVFIQYLLGHYKKSLPVNYKKGKLNFKFSVNFLTLKSYFINLFSKVLLDNNKHKVTLQYYHFGAKNYA